MVDVHPVRLDDAQDAGASLGRTGSSAVVDAPVALAARLRDEFRPA